MIKMELENDCVMTRCGYFTLSADNVLEMHGFPGITETTRCKLNVVDNGIIAIFPDDMLKKEESIAFTEETRKMDVVVNYFLKHNGINVLFTKIFDGYFSCPDLKVQ